MNELNNLCREEIPQEVLDDISKHFSTVIWDNYGKDVPRLDVKTRVSNYEKAIFGFTVTLMERSYIRGVFDEHTDSLDIYSVWSTVVKETDNA